MRKLYLISIFVIILIMISFGVLASYLPDECTFYVGFGCLDYSINYGSDGTDGQIMLKLKNFLYQVEREKVEAIEIEKIEAFDENGELLCTIISDEKIWKSNETMEFLSNTNCNLKSIRLISSKDHFRAKINFKIFYKYSNSSDIRIAEGEIFTRVEGLEPNKLFPFYIVSLILIFLVLLYFIINKKFDKKTNNEIIRSFLKPTIAKIIIFLFILFYIYRELFTLREIPGPSEIFDLLFSPILILPVSLWLILILPYSYLIACIIVSLFNSIKKIIIKKR